MFSRFKLTVSYVMPAGTGKYNSWLYHSHAPKRQCVAFAYCTTAALTKSAFFWEYSRIGILGIDGICVLLGAIPFSEWTEYHSVHSASDSRMNRMEGMWFTRNRQNTRSFGKLLAGNPTRPPFSLTLKCVRRYSSSQVTSDSVSRSETCRSILFEIEIDPCILLS